MFTNSVLNSEFNTYFFTSSIFFINIASGFFLSLRFILYILAHASTLFASHTKPYTVSVLIATTFPEFKSLITFSISCLIIIV